jgi:hypothetical protein
MENATSRSMKIAVFLLFWLVMGGIAAFVYSIVYFPEWGRFTFWGYIISIAVSMLVARRIVLGGLALLLLAFLVKDWLIFGSDVFQPDYIYSLGILCFVTLVLLVAYAAADRKLVRMNSGSPPG